MNNYYKYQFQCTSSSVEEWGFDLLQQELADEGFETFEMHDDICTLEAYIPSGISEKWNGVSGHHLSSQMNLEWNYTVELVPGQNWNQTWEVEGFSPIAIGSDILIRALHHVEERPFRYTVLIEPKASFGSGHHQTTQMMLRLLLSLDLRGKNVIDMGCGTGILGLSAAKMGAGRVLCVDIDSACVDNTLHNASLNELPDPSSFVCLIGDAHLPVQARYSADVYLANIHRNIIINDLPLYKKVLRSRGILLLSGMLQEDEEQIVYKLGLHGFNLLKILYQDGWIALATQLGSSAQ